MQLEHQIVDAVGLILGLKILHQSLNHAIAHDAIARVTRLGHHFFPHLLHHRAAGMGFSGFGFSPLAHQSHIHRGLSGLATTKGLGP